MRSKPCDGRVLPLCEVCEWPARAALAAAFTSIWTSFGSLWVLLWVVAAVIAAFLTSVQAVHR